MLVMWLHISPGTVRNYLSAAIGNRIEAYRPARQKARR